MITLEELSTYLTSILYYDKKLNVEKIDPYMTNGLMVKGKNEVKKIGFSVSASVELFKQAQLKNCDALIVHHAFNFPPNNRYDQIFQGRFEYLMKQEMSLFGFHFLLDAHPEIGNNAQLLKKIGAEKKEPYMHRASPWGWVGECKIPSSLNSIKNEIKKISETELVIYDFGPKEIKKVAVVSGKGAPLPSDMQMLIDNKIDLFVTGEVHEWNRELFREAGIHFIAAGHYGTETLGVKSLKEKIQSEMPSVETEWLELFNQV